VTEERFIVTSKKSFDALGTTLRTHKAYRSCYDSTCGYADTSHDALSRVRTVTAFAGDFWKEACQLVGGILPMKAITTLIVLAALLCSGVLY
jgi:hypothetical protein